MSDKTYKCAFKHCKHESCEIPQDKAVKVGNRYMHSDCAKTSDNITRIRDFYYENISKTVVMKQLVSVINNLVFTKDIDSGYLLFALNHSVAAKIPVKSPYGLHYLVDNQRIKDLFKKKKATEIANEIKKASESVEMEPVKSTGFNYSSSNNIGFGGILKGGN